LQVSDDGSDGGEGHHVRSPCKTHAAIQTIWMRSKCVLKAAGMGIHGQCPMEGWLPEVKKMLGRCRTGRSTGQTGNLPCLPFRHDLSSTRLAAARCTLPLRMDGFATFCPAGDRPLDAGPDIAPGTVQQAFTPHVPSGLGSFTDEDQGIAMYSAVFNLSEHVRVPTLNCWGRDAVAACEFGVAAASAAGINIAAGDDAAAAAADGAAAGDDDAVGAAADGAAAGDDAAVAAADGTVASDDVAAAADGAAAGDNVDAVAAADGAAAGDNVAAGAAADGAAEHCAQSGGVGFGTGAATLNPASAAAAAAAGAATSTAADGGAGGAGPADAPAVVPDAALTCDMSIKLAQVSRSLDDPPLPGGNAVLARGVLDGNQDHELAEADMQPTLASSPAADGDEQIPSHSEHVQDMCTIRSLQGSGARLRSMHAEDASVSPEPDATDCGGTGANSTKKSSASWPGDHADPGSQLVHGSHASTDVQDGSTPRSSGSLSDADADPFVVQSQGYIKILEHDLTLLKADHEKKQQQLAQLSPAWDIVEKRLSEKSDREQVIKDKISSAEYFGESLAQAIEKLSKKNDQSAKSMLDLVKQECEVNERDLELFNEEYTVLKSEISAMMDELKSKHDLEKEIADLEKQLEEGNELVRSLRRSMEAAQLCAAAKLHGMRGSF